MPVVSDASQLDTVVTAEEFLSTPRRKGRLGAIDFAMRTSVPWSVVTSGTPLTILSPCPISPLGNHQ
jgi:hypothetical protein